MDKACETHLLDAITEIHTSVGDGLNDDEFTFFLQKSALPNEAGFALVSYSERFVTLSVPPQNLAGWYPPKSWIDPEKERLARALADKYGLSLCEPPDALFTTVNTPNPHHHLELCDRRETVILIHPRYLKVRLFAPTDRSGLSRSAQIPQSLGPDLLPDLAALYRA